MGRRIDLESFWWVSQGVCGLAAMLALALVACAGSETEQGEGERATEVACVTACAKLEGTLPFCYGEGWPLDCEARCLEDESRAAFLACEECAGGADGQHRRCPEEADACEACERAIWGP